MKTICAIIVLLFGQITYAQLQPAMLSLKGIGGNGTDDILVNVNKTSDAGFIIRLESNSSNGTGNIDSFCSISGGKCIFIKYNSDASTIEWSKCYGYGGDSFLIYLFPTSTGEAILGGEFNSDNSWGFVIAKHDESDNVIWQKENRASLKTLYFSKTDFSE